MSRGSAATAREALERSRVDVIAMISDGIPPRAYVPGAPGLLPAGKRIHIAAEKKTGKSLSIAVVTAVQIVASGGTVVVLDRENGSDEYARRLEDVLDARGADDAFRERVRRHLRYHAWPTLSLDWSEDYPEAFASAEVAIFDSSRSHLTPLGLREDLSDDFAAFTTALIDPLMRAGIATVILDNAGHLEKDRPRGSSSKGDLCDIAFTMRTLSPFTSTLAGRLELRCTASRIGEVGGTWHLELGDGHYGTWQKIGARRPEARDDLRKAAIEVLVTAAAPLGIEKIGRSIRARPGNTLRFGAQDLRAGLAAWAEDPASGVLRDPAGKGFLAHVGPPRHGPHVGAPATGLDTASTHTAESPAPTSDLPVSDSLDTARPGAHVAESHPLRGDTADTRAEDDGYNGWTDAELQALVDSDYALGANEDSGC